MKSEKGFSLIEVLTSLFVLSILAVGFYSGLASISEMTVRNQQKDIGRVLVQSQMEYIKTATFEENCTYEASPIPVEYPGYSASIEAENINYDCAIQKIRITITKNNRVISVLEDYKVQ